MSADPKQILHGTMHRQEALSVADRFEPAHLIFALPCRLMRALRSVVLVLLRAVYDRRHHGTVRRGIGAQLVCDEPARRAALTFQQFPKETRGRLSSTPGLDEDVNDVTVLVNRPPEIPTPALNLHTELIQIPDVAQPTATAPQSPRVVEPERLTPLPNRFVRHGDPSFGEEVFDISNLGRNGGRARRRD